LQITSEHIQAVLQQALDKRKKESLYRSLQQPVGLIDFCSNDYLSFARSTALQQKVDAFVREHPHLSGSTGSRSISGNTAYAEELEKFLASFFNAEAGLIFNSGYDANVGFFSSIAKKDDTLICDELIHASIIDGCRLSYANRLRFSHNDVEDLEKKLQKINSGNIFVVVESVYSMDGDMAPLPQIALLCKKYNANLVVDEAHATGVFGKQGRGLVNHFGLEQDTFARIYTFGKAMGCHGAIVVGSEVLRNYLINFARSFIFTTALPFQSLVTIRIAFEELLSSAFDNSSLHALIKEFKSNWELHNSFSLIDSCSAVQAMIIPGNERARSVASQLQAKGFDVRAIVSPSVPVGKERLRISLHAHNTIEQVSLLKKSLKEILFV
jgi:8-amino-7-oxononanoate synthase